MRAARGGAARALAGLHEAVSAPPASPRALAAMREAERVSERLIAGLSLVGVALFFVVFFASTALYRAAPDFGPAPVALGVYAAAAAWRLRLLRERPLGPAARRLFDVAEVGVLMILIAAFTAQYHAPPALYLKAPTLFYAFTLIALRALRFDAVDVVVTGAAVAAGWFVLSLIAAEGAPEARDYPEYMASLSVYWGAEAEKIFAFAVVTAVLALAVARGKALLVRLSTEELAAREIARLVAPEAALRARGDDGLVAGDGVVRPTAVLFVDLRGFSGFAAAMDAAAVIAFLNEYQRRVVPIIEEAGGVVDKFLGDGVLATFVVRGGEAAAALGATPRLLEVWDAFTAERRAAGLPTPPLAAAATHGMVVHGLVGGGRRLEFTVVGDAVNLAAKLEKHAKQLGARVIATAAVFALAKEQGLAVAAQRTASQATVEGVGAPVDLVVLA